MHHKLSKDLEASMLNDFGRTVAQELADIAEGLRSRRILSSKSRAERYKELLEEGQRGQLQIAR